MSWMPIGMPSAEKPIGTDIDGKPVLVDKNENLI